MQDLVLEPVPVRRRGQPAGSLNNFVSTPSTHRDPSSFEHVIFQEENRGRRGRRGRGEGTRARNGIRARGRGRTQHDNEDTEHASANRGGNRRGRPRGRPHGSGRGGEGRGGRANSEQSGLSDPLSPSSEDVKRARSRVCYNLYKTSIQKLSLEKEKKKEQRRLGGTL